MTDTTVMTQDSSQTDWVLKYADKSVVDALQGAHITRQHAQLLAVLSKERQASTVKALLGLESLPSVLELCQGIEARAIPLDGMPFDTVSEQSSCFNCLHNSNVHSRFFEKHIGAGFCTNGTCANQLWQKHAEGIKDTLPLKYKVIRIEPEFSGTRLCADDSSVGSAQFDACSTTCQSYGASIVGNASKGIQQVVDACYDHECHAQKVLALKASQLEKTREKIWRTGLQRFVFEADRGLNRVLMLCMAAGGWKLPADFGERVFGKSVDPASAFALATESVSTEKLTEGLHEMAVAMVETAPIHQVQELVKALNVPLGTYFPMQKSFLKSLSVNDIEHLMKELNINANDDMNMAKQVSPEAFAEAVAKAIPEAALRGYLPHVLRP